MFQVALLKAQCSRHIQGRIHPDIYLRNYPTGILANLLPQVICSFGDEAIQAPLA
jgi:hypothetical protein